MEKPMPVKIAYAGRIPLTKEGLAHIHAQIGDVVILVPHKDGRLCIEKFVGSKA
jgi:hypothetical protein